MNRRRALPGGGGHGRNIGDAGRMGGSHGVAQVSNKTVVSDESYHSQSPTDGENGEGGIRTPGTGVTQYDGLANRCFQPLSHLSTCACAIGPGAQDGGVMGHSSGTEMFGNLY